MAIVDSVQPYHVVAILAVAVAVALISSLMRKTKYRYPPGPKGIPIFGNLFQLPPAYPGAKLMEWGQEYGDL